MGHDRDPKDRPRPKRRQITLEVLGAERIAAHMVRVRAGGEGFAEFASSGFADQYVKILFADPALNLPRPYDLDAIRAEHGKAAVPVRRTYTIRRVLADSLEIDFVTHGEAGLAGPWAASATRGDLLTFSGPGGKFSPRPGAWHLLAGDESSLPAISSVLEAMGPAERGVALIEVGTEADRLPVTAPAGVEVRWLYRGGDFTPENTRLYDAVAAVALPVPVDEVEAFVHGERSVMKAMRRLLMDEFGMQKTQLSLSAYWAYGRVEDQFQAEKREKVGQIFED